MTSNINPNNIDGQYPIAGQDNNSQGFRDNFTNTKTNFAYAAAEITDLQNKVVLKAALTGGTLNNNMLGSILSNFQGQNISGTVVALGTLSGSVGINYAAGPYQTVTTSGPISLAFTNFTPAGTQDTVLVQVTVSNTADTLTLPSAVGTGASATSLIGIQGLDSMTNTITFAATGTYVYSFTTTDSGTTIYLNDLTQSRIGFSGNVSVAGNLSVTGTITGNIEINNIESIVGNVTAGNLLTGGLVSATANVTGGNILTVGLISATGNLTAGNISSGGLINITANVTGGNILTGGLVSATANVTGGNILTAGTVSATGNIDGGNIVSSTSGQISTNGNVTGGYLRTAEVWTNIGNGGNAIVNGGGNGVGNIGNSSGYFNIAFLSAVSASGNVAGGALLSTGIVSATGNIIGGNLKTSATLINSGVSTSGNVTGGNVISNGSTSTNISVIVPVRADITATNTYSLSTTNSINLLVANNTGYTATLDMPGSPVNGQICNFSVLGNAVTLAVGTGTVSPTFAGLTAAGTGYRYCYYTTDATWYRIG